MKHLITAVFSFALVFNVGAQRSKVQTAWRALNDYESSEKDDKADINFLNKAKEAIDIALSNPDTKNQTKAHAYKARISYAFYRHQLNQELKRLEATVPDKNERAMTAYGNTPLDNFETANEEILKLKYLDPKFVETISEGLSKGTSMLDEDEQKFAVMVQQMKMESANIAQGKYKTKNYDEAADYFYKTGVLNTVLFRVKDTANFYNACVAAGKAKNNAKILEYNRYMIDAKIGTAYNYENLYALSISKSDTLGAREILKSGRNAFPNDLSLLNKETDYYLAKGQQQQALENLKMAIEKDPKNPVFYIFVGQIYDGMANPKDKSNNKDLPKPANYEELIKNAENYYLKGIALNPSSKDYRYNLVFNLGVLYNNQGAYYQSKFSDKPGDVSKTQKELELKSQESFKKAVPYLEQALSIKPDDKPTMSALRMLYMYTKEEEKARQMNDKLKSAK
jgi:Flp pilus assembly protein TadD